MVAFSSLFYRMSFCVAVLYFVICAILVRRVKIELCVSVCSYPIIFLVVCGVVLLV